MFVIKTAAYALAGYVAGRLLQKGVVAYMTKRDGEFAESYARTLPHVGGSIDENW